AAPVVGTGTITDNDGTPTLSIAGPDLVNEAVGTVTYTVTLSNPSASSVSVSYSTANGTALAGSDYTANSGILTFAPGETTKTITVAVTNDTVFEGNETYVVNLTSPSNATIATGSVSTTIADYGTGLGGNNDDRPTLAVNSVSHPESDPYAVFTVSLSNASAAPTTVSLSLANGTATAPADYTTALQYSTNGGATWTTGTSATIAAGSTSILVRVPIVNDILDEANETFTLTATRTAGTTLNASATGTATIVDNDSPPVAVIDNRTAPEDTVVTGNVLSNDTDADGNTLSVTQFVVNGVTYPAGTSAVNLPGVGSLVVNTDGGYTFTPSLNYNGSVPQVTYTVTDGANTATSTLNITLTPVNDAPVAQNDTNTVTEDGVTTLNVNAANGVIQSALAASGRDSDPEGDLLNVVAIRTGSEGGSGTAGSVGAALVGTYGTLTLRSDGSYDYVLNNSSVAVQNLMAGQVVQDVFTYTISDGQGGSDLATLSINVNGALDIVAPPPTVTPLTGAASGLNGEYYGYNGTVGAGTRSHGDDGTATFGLHSEAGNLNAVEDLYQIIDGRNVAGGGGNIVGTAGSAASNVADVSFRARALDYGFNPTVNSSLGSNQAVAAGSGLLAKDNNANSTTRALSNFLDQDLGTGVVQTGALNTNGTSGLGQTTDAAIRLSGKFYVQPGSYDFRVTADDGFRLQVAGQTLIEYDGNQGPTTRVFNSVQLGNLAGGLQELELLYWEQGGNARLRIEYKASSSGTWETMSLSNTAMFTNETAPTITDPRIQDLVYDTATSQWMLRTGAILDGDATNNTLTGGAGRDFLTGNGGNDTLIGNGGADQLDGGAGNDNLQGGDGNDLLIGGPGSDTLIGGLGDDVYRLSDTGDTLTELVSQGIDTIQLDSTYVAANAGTNYTLAANFENLTAFDGGAINLTGNSAANRIEGNASSNTISGGAGNDYIIGGGGDDTLTGGSGADTFAWRLADSGAPGAPAVDHVTDFNYGGGYSNVDNGSGAPTGGGDVLDLRDLLVGERTTSSNSGSGVSSVEIDDLLTYIDVNVSGGNTELRISKTGGFSGGTYASGAEDQRIVLDGVNLYSATGVAAGDEATLLKTLIKNGTLIVD
ncbi:Calx-beta domain-containing protein, partial [uncultured Dechloromonas sp.]|uniref:Calx-beta domain-containing protein n=1 Tax=uncultured Dechloromonas sp. TaxID=171719 RepID=UPI0025FC9601